MASWKKVIVSGSAAVLASLTLDTDLAVAHGGTGASTLTDGSVLVGNGTSAITALAVGNTQIIIGDGSGDPTVAALSGDVTMTNAGVVSLAADSVDSAEIADDAIDSEHYTDGSIDNAHIADDAIDSEHYAAASIDTAHIANLQITTGLIAADAVTAAKIGDDVINSEHYAAGSIDNEHLADNAVDSAELAAGSVDNAHLAGSIAVSKTSLAAGTNITLATNTLNVDDAFLVNDGSDTTTGTITAAGFTTTGTWTFDTDTATAGITTIQTGSTFVDVDTAIMSAGAIKEKIEDYGYGVGGGDITGVTAGDGIQGGGASGGVTVAVDVSDFAGNGLEDDGSENLRVDISGLSSTLTAVDQADYIAVADEDATNDETKKITFSHFEDEIFGNVSGDASIAAGGALTIAATSVENSMLAGSIAVSKTSLAAGTNITLATNTLNVDDAFLVNDGSDTTSGTITAAGFTTTGTWTFDEYSSGTIGITTVQDSGTSFNDNDTSLMTAAAIADKVEAYGYSTTDVSVSKDNLETTLALMDTNYTLGSGTSIDGTISGDLTVTGDLTVSGATITANVTNLNIADKFINLNDGGSAADAGLVFEGQGASLGWDESAHRLAFDFTGATEDQTAISSDAFICSVVTASNASYQYNGNIKIESSTIYIYVE